MASVDFSLKPAGIASALLSVIWTRWAEKIARHLRWQSAALVGVEEAEAEVVGCVGLFV
jgi:hypothetical protein